MGASLVSVERNLVTSVDAGAYAIDFSIFAPNRTRHTGHI
jgi:hypothetical protein